MDATLKQRWVDALRNNGEKKYQKGRGRLKCNGAFCAIGVLLDVYNPDAWRPGYDTYTPDDWVLPGHSGHSKYALAGLHADVLGLSMDVVDEIVNMSDGHYSFNEIADFIAQNNAI